ncbi:DUF4382 domain-containing protein [uncultured Arcticibacterium sp.]|uniref:DUF4382 domain-containing protein n=1 Tax=uncultured Arcticibacterium sp. TaxID=2173042 RepID=UPI0030F7045D
MRKQSRILALGVLALSMFAFSCDDNDSTPKGDINDPDQAQGSLSFGITDAPIDQADVSAAFITVTEIKVDGQTFGGFQGPKTFNLLELQNGTSLDLGQGNVAAGSYSSLELVIDAESDATGSGPGCYILKTDGTKEKLELASGSATSITMAPSDFKVEENANTEIIMDFDLRKSVKSSGGDYSFVTNNELNAAVRAENKAMTGAIKGKIDNAAAASGKVVVYVYEKGTFDASTETSGQGSSEVMYANAVSSAKVNADGTFNLSFLSEGNYEIQCDMPEEGDSGLGLSTLLELESSVDLSNVGVNAGAETNLNLSLKLDGILGGSINL